MTYQITLQQLDILSHIICDMDGRNHPKTNQLNAGKAHAMIQQVLGKDARKLYAPDNKPKVA